MNILLMIVGKCEIAEFIPLYPGNFSKEDAQNTEMGGYLRPGTDSHPYRGQRKLAAIRQRILIVKFG